MLGVFLGALAVGLAYAAAFFPPPFPSAAPWLMLLGITLLVFSLLILGTRRPGRPVSVGVVLGLGCCALVLLLGFGLALALPPETAGSALLLGLPRRAAVLVYGVGLLPALVIPLAYALSFRTTVLEQRELAALRARLAACRLEHPTE
jgi:hypothetical protein